MNNYRLGLLRKMNILLRFICFFFLFLTVSSCFTIRKVSFTPPSGWQELTSESDLSLSTDVGVSMSADMAYRKKGVGTVYILRYRGRKSIEKLREKVLKRVVNFEKLPVGRTFMRKNAFSKEKPVKEEVRNINGNEMLYIVRELDLMLSKPPYNEKKVIEHYLLFSDSVNNVEMISRNESMKNNPQKYEKEIFQLYNTFEIEPPNSKNMNKKTLGIF